MLFLLLLVAVILLLFDTKKENFALIKDKKICLPKLFDKNIAGVKVKIGGPCFDVPEPDGEGIKKDLINPAIDTLTNVFSTMKFIIK